MDHFSFRLAGPSDADDVFALYRSLVGTPFCAWDDTYPAMEHVSDDIAAGALYVLTEGGVSLAAAGAFRRCVEHDTLAEWPSSNPCDLMRIGVSRSLQGRGVGGLFLSKLLDAARDRGYDVMRILVAKTNAPAISMYRKAGAVFTGSAFSYGIDWHCTYIKL